MTMTPLKSLSEPRQMTLDEIKHNAIDTVESNAHAEWLSAAERVVMHLATHRPHFTSDDVWRELDKLQVKTHEPRALGAVMRKASRNRVIYRTGRTVDSLRASRHLAPIAIWGSKIYRGGGR